MGLFDAFRYDGKRAVVVGGASGMGRGRRRARAGRRRRGRGDGLRRQSRSRARRRSTSTSPTRDRSTPRSTSAAGRCTRCSRARAWPTARPSIEKINFIGHRHLIDRMLAGGMLAPGRRHRLHLVGRRPRLGAEPPAPATSTSTSPTSTPRRSGRRSTARPTTCGASRRSARTSRRQAMPFLKQGIRINAICPGPTDTPLAQANKDTVARLRRRLPRRGRASRRRRRWSRRTRSCSCAATPRWRSPARR